MNDATEETGSTAPSQPGFGGRIARALQRFAGALFSPGKTFREIGAAPDWLVPLLVIMVIGVISTQLIWPSLDIEGSTRATMEARGSTDEQIEQALAGQRAFMDVAGPIMKYSFPTVGAAIYFVILTLIYWGGATAFGGRISFGRTFSVLLYSWGIRVVEQILLVFTVQGRQVFSDRLDIQLFTNPAYFLPIADFGTPMFTFFRALNLFTLFWLGILAVGLSEVGKMSRGTAFTLVFVLFGLYVAIWVGFSALF